MSIVQHTVPVTGAKSRISALKRKVFVLKHGKGKKATAHRFSADSVTIGSQPGNQLQLDDHTVSRFHARLELDAGGYLLRDLESTNGTWLESRRVQAAYLQPGDKIHLGESELTFLVEKEEVSIDLAREDRFGALLGASTLMRKLFVEIERIAPSESTVMLYGETGCGKELVAQELHNHSKRHEGPFVVLDCAGIPPTLIEAELFGYERGAFTGADTSHTGALEEANGGTLFIDEIGELPLALQTRLLRVLESRKVKRIGGAEWIPLDLRIVSATHRDLALLCNQGLFREDLYFRMAVVIIEIPPLRKRLEDIPLLIEAILAEIAPATRLTIDNEILAALRNRRWRGNVRELRNLVHRAVALGSEELAKTDEGDLDGSGPDTPFRIARARAIEEFEKTYLIQLLELHRGEVKKAAQAAGVAPTWIFRLVKRHAIDLRSFR